MLDFKQQYPELVLQTANGNPALNRFSEFSEALIQAQLHLLDLKTAAAEAKAAGGDPDALKRVVDRFQLSTTVTAETDPALLAEYRAARLRLDDLMTELGPNHQSVQEAARHLGGVQAELQRASFDAANSYVAIIQGALTAAQQRVAQLETAVDGERRSATKMNLKQEQFEQLAQTADRIEKSMDLLDGRMGEIDVTADVGALTVSVLETATPGGSPVRPKAAQVAGIGLLAGLMVGIGGALLRDLMDQRLRTTEEISTLLRLPVLGAVPFNLSSKTSRHESAMELHLRPRSQASEAYRTVRTAIHFGASDERPSKTILVTSPQPGDGKSTMASNLAIGIAQAGRRVLLIDADCRRPMQHELFRVDDKIGLSNILMGDAVTDGVVQKTGVDRLDILVCGPLPDNPAELLNGQKFLDVLKEASEVYDQVVIDSPPVMAVADARIIAASCDVTILVLRAGASTRKMAERALEALESVGAAVLGVVVNAVPRGNDGYGYYYHRYSYGNGNGKHPGNGNGHGNGGSDLASTTVVAQGTLED
jgi:capsular exopolysaccharide synthesis family protein